MPTPPISLKQAEFFHPVPDHTTEPTALLRLQDLIDYEINNPNSKVELVNGKILPMARATGTHNAIVGNIFLNIQPYLLDCQSKCFSYTSDIRVRVNAHTYRYPDFLIDCSGRLVDIYAENPVLVAEVLSDNSTATLDKTEKLTEYQKIASIQEILLLSQVKKQVLVYRRNGFLFGTDWTCDTYTQGDIPLTCIRFSVAVNDLYRRVEI